MTEAKRPITADDLNKIQALQDPQISPDGKYVAFVKITPDPLNKTYKRNIWLLPTHDGDAFQLTRSNSDSGPRWSPDATQLAFTSGRGEKPQIYLLPTAAPGGEARALTEMENGAHSPSWSPDGRQIAFLSPMTADERAAEQADSDPPAEAKDKLESKQRKERKAEDELNRWDPRPMWRIPYRQGTSYVDERYDQVYLTNTAEADDSTPRRLTDLNASYSQPRWSVDGGSIYSDRTTIPEGDEPWRAKNIFRLDLESGEETALTDGEYSAYAPSPSPDGKWIAYGRGHIGLTDMPERLVIMSTDGAESRLINESLDREAFDWAWSPESRLALSIESEGNVLPWFYDPQTEELAQVHDGRYEIEQISTGADGLLAMTVSTPRNPQELYILSGGAFREATAFNHDWLDEVIVQEVHELRFNSPQGAVQGWYLHPVGYESGKTYPLALNIHGGPHAAWGFSTKSMWHEWQFHAARGYAVFYCNPHGSGGYGEAFMRKLHAAWGPVAMDDIMAGIDAFLALGIADENRMAITGGSYGGYMTAWIISHTGRFKAAVSQRGVYNISSFYGTSDVPLLMSNEFDAEPWANHDVYWDNSPLKYAADITTPLLLIHSENDFRVPIEQAEQLFAWVRRATDTPVRMLRYPREGHELSRSGEPGHRVSRLTEMIHWFDRYV
ncbi:MAG: S9 family peptidase [Chloroflexi bacterium]|nr:S9 family peptidase [Chloroflexota bacterium]